MICEKCKIEKDIKHYKRSDIICNTCYRKELKFSKSCNKCKNRVDTSLFSENKKICNNCIDIMNYELLSKKKLCNKCGLEKDIDRFNKNICYDCYNKYRNYRISTGLSKKYPTNKSVMKTWRENNKERLREYRNNYSKDKYNNDIEHKLKVVCRSFIRRCLYSKNNERTFDVLGYDTNKLRIRLEFQFTSEMSWSNYGSYWNIDHKKPLSLFSKDTPISTINALCNLKPVVKEFNYSKQNKFIN